MTRDAYLSDFQRKMCWYSTIITTQRRQEVVVYPLCQKSMFPVIITERLMNRTTLICQLQLSIGHNLSFFNCCLVVDMDYVLLHVFADMSCLQYISTLYAQP